MHVFFLYKEDQEKGKEKKRKRGKKERKKKKKKQRKEKEKLRFARCIRRRKERPLKEIKVVVLIPKIKLCRL